MGKDEAFVAVTVDPKTEMEVQEILRAFPKKVAGKIKRKALRQAATVVANDAKTLAPVDTGAMKGEIKVRALDKQYKKNRSDIGMMVKVDSSRLMTRTGKDYPHSVAIEYGARHMSPKPFLRPAAKRNRETVADFYVLAVQEQIRDMRKSS